MHVQMHRLIQIKPTRMLAGKVLQKYAFMNE